MEQWKALRENATLYSSHQPGLLGNHQCHVARIHGSNLGHSNGGGGLKGHAFAHLIATAVDSEERSLPINNFGPGASGRVNEAMGPARLFYECHIHQRTYCAYLLSPRAQTCGLENLASGANRPRLTLCRAEPAPCIRISSNPYQRSSSAGTV